MYAKCKRESGDLRIECRHHPGKSLTLLQMYDITALKEVERKKEWTYVTWDSSILTKNWRVKITEQVYIHSGF